MGVCLSYVFFPLKDNKVHHPNLEMLCFHLVSSLCQSVTHCGYLPVFCRKYTVYFSFFSSTALFSFKTKLLSYNKEGENTSCKFS